MPFPTPRKLVQRFYSNSQRNTQSSLSPSSVVQPLGLDQQQSAGTSPSPWDVYEATHNQKLMLLQKAIEESVYSRSEALDKAQRFRRYFAKTAEEFNLKHEAVEDAPLRLLCRANTIQKLKCGDFSCPSFVALSYCWRNDSWTPTTHLRHPESELPISPEMVKKLDCLIQEDEGIWIDQICINQNDPDEKNAVIGVMDFIYKSAREVLVPLEDISISVDEILLLDEFTEKGLERFSQAFANHQPLEASQLVIQLIVPIVAKIASARWFNRAWCFHELHCHGECTFLIPSERDIFCRRSQWLRLALSQIELLKVSGYRSKPDLYTQLNANVASCTKKLVYPDSLLQMSSTLENLDSAIDTDKISIALNLFSVSLYYRGQTKTRTECRFILDLIALSGGDARALLNLISGHQNESGNQISSSSSDMSQMNMELSLLAENCQIAKRDGIQSLSLDQMRLSVIELTISKVRRPKVHFIERSQEFLRLMFSYLQGRHFCFRQWCDENAVGQPAALNLLVQVFACSFDCGLEWMIRQMKEAPDLALQVQAHMDDRSFTEHHEGEILGGLIKSNLVGEAQWRALLQEEKGNILKYLYLLLFVAEFGYAARSNIDELTQNKSQPQTAAAGSMECWIVEIEPGEPAILIRPSREKVKYHKMVLPIALNNSSCAMSRRVFCLQRVDNSSGKVVSSLYLLTLLPLKERVSEMQGERVKDVMIKLR
ncbi:MAG: hypothetical protein Q9167_006134 [Letrouitia subvulpina]